MALQCFRRGDTAAGRTILSRKEKGSKRVTHVVVWVQDSGYVLCQVSVQHRLNVVTHIDCSKRERESSSWRGSGRSLTHTHTDV